MTALLSTTGKLEGTRPMWVLDLCADTYTQLEECSPWLRESGRSSRTTVVAHVSTASVFVCVPVQVARSWLHVVVRAVRS
ncbi:50S ribosomal protein L34 [Corynebacterium pseudotuberculosis]|nr:50S ribosomal protein L34 [Corynebacterium pseudotuberculosis]ALP34797.1 50S ribosomal protein L34 [Corynebacterium pseudotuberculosis]APZ32871.1 50S ribosomal protein L34 [Corynebacterium pseudotuberculosis]AQU91694.1 50S ribosomal protein L34 [Corynebacterium pseudotuberculosis]ARS61665.1 50S ribosomal protein L34 [Corynebacterium pseudotuberculosis]